MVQQKTIPEKGPGFNIVDFATGRLTKFADTAIERFAMGKDGQIIIGSSNEGSTPPEARVAELNLSREKNNTSNIVNDDPFKVIKDNKLPIILGSVGIILGTILLVAKTKGK